VAELFQAVAACYRRRYWWLGVVPQLATGGGGHGEPILGFRGSGRSSSKAGDDGGMQGGHDSVEGRLQWMSQSASGR
jgi:hypothetical protein